MAVVFIAMTGVLLLFSRIYISSKTVHPDGIVTMVNPTTDQRVQAYAIGKMQVYIDMAYRMDLPVWNMYLRTLAQQYDHSVPELTGEQDTNLALNRENPDADINPFILRLTIRNISDTPIDIKAESFNLRTLDDDIITPDLAWAKVLDEIGFFAGCGNTTKLEAGDTKTLWLVYGAPSKENVDEMDLQEYVRVNYGSDNELFATKVEFPTTRSASRLQTMVLSRMPPLVIVLLSSSSGSQSMASQSSKSKTISMNTKKAERIE